MTDDQITIIPRGCDSLQFNQDEIESSWLEDWYKEFPQTIGKKILTLPTRITKWKGVDSFIDLVEAINSNDMHALVVGPVSESKKRYYQTLLDKVNKKSLSDKITFTGSRNDIANIYKISDIVYNLSIQPEPFGRTTIEAISCGTPVAGWRHGGTQEILEDLFPQGLAELSNTDELKDVTLNILNNNDKPLENTFTSERMIDSTINLYYDLLNKSS
jgi:glycosyltransferase involved in cell wall biosynthesis